MSDIIFNNTTNQTVELYWINYEGEDKKISEIQANSKFEKIYTFVTHPWYCIRKTDKQKQLINGAEMYYP